MQCRNTVQCSLQCDAAVQHAAQHAVQNGVQHAAQCSMQSSPYYAQAIAALLPVFQQDAADATEFDQLSGKSAKDGLWQHLVRAREQPRLKCLVMLPVHSEAAKHWSLLVMRRKASAADLTQPAKKFKIMYLDSMAQPSQPQLEAARASLHLLVRLVAPAQVEMPELPLRSTDLGFRQTDAWSCGYWTLRHAETVYRLHRGEGWRLLSSDLHQMRESWNAWLDQLRRYSQKRKVQEEAPEEKEKKQQKLAVAVAAAGASSSTSLPQAPLPANTVQQDDLNHGCSKCRYSLGGCLACCPAKAVKYGQSKLAESQP